LQLADRLKSVAGMDASGQIRHDHACRQLHVARPAGRRARPGWTATQDKEALDWMKAFSSEEKRLLIYQVDGDWFAFGPTGISGRDIRTHRPG
jgi:hypothetical protein